MENNRTIFISYSSIDKEIANALCDHLEQSGLSCWIAPRDITPGKSYAALIVEAINQARIMVLVFSANSNASDHVLNEVERAFNKRITIIPFRISETMPSESFEYFLSLKHWLDAFDKPSQAYFGILAKECGKLLDQPVVSVNRPAAQPTTSPTRQSDRTPINRNLMWGLLAVPFLLLAGYLIQTKFNPEEIDNNNLTIDSIAAPETVVLPQTTVVDTPKKSVKRKVLPKGDLNIVSEETTSLNNATFENAATGDVLRFSKNGTSSYHFSGNINGNAVSGTAKHQGYSAYKISGTGSIKGSFNVNDNTLTASVSLNQNGVSFSPGEITLKKK